MPSFDLGKVVRVTRVLAAGTPTAYRISQELLEGYHRQGYAVYLKPSAAPALDCPGLLEAQFSKADGTQVSASVQLTPGVPVGGLRQTEVDVALAGQVVVGGAKGMFASASLVRKIAREKLVEYLDRILADVPAEAATPPPSPEESLESVPEAPNAEEEGAEEEGAEEERGDGEDQRTGEGEGPSSDTAGGGQSEAARSAREAELAAHDAEIARIEAEVLAAEAKLALQQAEVDSLEAEVAAEEAAANSEQLGGAAQSTRSEGLSSSPDILDADAVAPQAGQDALDLSHEEMLEQIERDVALAEAEIDEALASMSPEELVAYEAAQAEPQDPFAAVGDFGAAAAEALLSATSGAFAAAEALIDAGARALSGESSAQARETDLPPPEPLPPAERPPAPESLPRSERPPAAEPIPAPEPIPAAAPPSDSADVEVRLATVKDLFDRGLISEDEFRAKKSELLERFF